MERNMLLIGKKGLNQLEDAKKLARDYLGSGPEGHPDYLYVGNKGRLHAEDLMPVYEKTALRPCRAEKHVILIDGIDGATAAAQNKLLKALEDAKNAYFILTAYGAGVLPTVKSRVAVKKYMPLPKKEFMAEGRSEAAYYMTGGCPGLLGDGPSKAEAVFGSVLRDYRSGDRAEVLNDLHLVTEKDRDSFFEAYREYVPDMIAMFGELLTEGHGKAGGGLLRKAKALAGHYAACGTSAYTSADFFVAAATFLSEGGERGDVI